MKNVFIISTVFPPNGGGGVERVFRFSDGLAEIGHDVTVWTPLISNNAWRTANEDYDISKLKINRLKNPLDAKGFFSLLSRSIRIIDSFFLWSLIVISSVFRYRKDGFDVIITTGPPHSVHLVGLFYRFFFGKLWISDFRDHFTLNPGKGNFYRRFYYHIERIFLYYSTFSLINTKHNLQEIKGHFKSLDYNKLCYLPNGFFLLRSEENGNSLISLDSDFINLVYAGGLRGFQVDEIIYRLILQYNAIGSKKKVRFYFVGDNSKFETKRYSQLVNNSIFLIDPIPYQNLISFLNHFDGCIMWQQESISLKGTVPTKFYDYLLSGKPIFSIGQPESELSYLFQELNCGYHWTYGSDLDLLTTFDSFLETINDFPPININLLNSFDRHNHVLFLHNLIQR
jgi:hypothetical protein